MAQNADIKEIVNRYLKYSKGEAFLFGKGTYSDKKYIWVQKTKDTYVPGEVLSDKGDKIVARDPEANEITIDAKDRDMIAWINPPKFDGVDDCAELSYLSEPAVLHNLRKRYDSDMIYTYSGLFCVVINPYRLFPIYHPVVVEHYRGKRRNEVPPHVFAIADGAYRSMLGDRVNQSILITGESGAGKTENTKKVIQYMAAIAGRVGGGKLEEQIIQANPILESFGNAKTIRNNNSSRFGKFIEIQFNQAGFICGASIVSYLLEKSRVTWQAPSERGFHIFYQLLLGSPAESKKSLKLRAANDYEYLNKSGTNSIKGVDDVDEYNKTIKAMQICAFKQEEIDGVMKVVAGILHLGNLKFGTILQDHRKSSRKTLSTPSPKFSDWTPRNSTRVSVNHASRLVTNSSKPN